MLGELRSIVHGPEVLISPAERHSCHPPSKLAGRIGGAATSRVISLAAGRAR
ncbi:MAG TPA: hypothetical protein VLX31_14410 [Streptosporangiaceae bacterium]|nr:hypothetical protein [Streptosporangiaceae bacterium]